MRKGLLLCLALMGCETVSGPDGGTDNTDGQTDSSTDDPPTPGACGDVQASIDEQACRTAIYYDDVNMATMYIAGELSLSNAQNPSEGDAVTGTVQQRLFPNPNLESTGFPADGCTIQWDVDGAVTAINRTGDYGLELFLTVNENASDCPPDPTGATFYDGLENITDVLDVRLSGETSRVFYGGSGNQLGEGCAAGGDLTYLSDHSCYNL